MSDNRWREVDFSSYVFNEVIVNDEFYYETAKLHSLNKLSGKVFNPVSLFLSSNDMEFDDALEMLVGRVASSFVDGGLLSTTDGITFDSVLDNDADSIYFKNVSDFAQVVNGDSQSFIESTISSIKNTINQGTGLLFEPTPTRSIIAQALGYDNDNGKYKHLSYSGSVIDGDMNLSYINQHGGGHFEKGLGSEGAYKYIFGIFEDVKSKIEKVLNLNKEDIGKMSPNVEVFVDKEIFTNESSPSFVQSGSNGVISNWVDDKDLKKEFDTKWGTLSGSILSSPLQTVQNSDFNNFISPNGEYETLQTGSVNYISGGDEYNVKNIRNYYKNKKENGRDDIFTFYKKHEKVDTYDDKILISDIGSKSIDDTNQFIKFTDIRTKQSVYFRPTIESISDSFQVDSSEQANQGGAEGDYMYEKTTRNITLTFYIYSSTPNEFLMNRKKIQFLKYLCYPSLISNNTIYQLPLIRFKLGDDYDYGGIVTSLNIDPESNSPWEIEKDVMGAKIFSVSMTFKIMHDKQPIYNDNEYDTILNYKGYNDNGKIEPEIENLQINATTIEKKNKNQIPRNRNRFIEEIDHNPLSESYLKQNPYNQY